MQKEKYLPNVRRLFRPDAGHMLFDIDLSGADAQVVGWESGDERLKAMLQSGVKLHVHNFEDLVGRKFDPDKDKRVIPPGWNYTPYDSMKRFVHATNYYAQPRTVAITLGWKVAEADARQKRWFNLYPGIRAWHERTAFELQTTRTIRNQFGYRIVYFDRPDSVLPEALAWKPQSTVAVLCSRAGVLLRRVSKALNILMQVHDSLVFQLPFHLVQPSMLEKIREAVHIPIPYPEPLLIPWSISKSEKSWADVESTTWT